MKIVTSNINNPLWGGLIRINPLHEWRVTTRSVTIRSCKSWKKGGGKRGKRGEKGGKGESTICHLCDITLFYIRAFFFNWITMRQRSVKQNMFYFEMTCKKLFLALLYFDLSSSCATKTVVKLIIICWITIVVSSATIGLYGYVQSTGSKIAWKILWLIISRYRKLVEKNMPSIHNRIILTF